jgi:threonine synthase
MASFVTELRCIVCDRAYRPETVEMTCPSCGPAEGILDVEYDLGAVRNSWDTWPLSERERTLWRYRELLPLDQKRIPGDWVVGWTPILEAPRLAGELGIAQLLLKDESRTLTASFKDRASAIAVADALQRESEVVACASTGNAATSLAGFAALAGLPAVIFVPQTAPEPKLAQLLVYGATVFAVQGSYGQAFQLCSQACGKYGWYNRNCAVNPFLVEGKKTGGLEIAEQCAKHGGAPDWVAVSVGDGCTIAGIWKGLRQMHELGELVRLPRLLGVQAAAVAPVAHAFERGALPPPTDANTLADSINVQVPRNWRKAVRSLRESSGVMVTVPDEAILQAMRDLGRHGLFAEPAAATAFAGVRAAVESGIIGGEERVLAMMTGSGLKDTRSAIRAGGEPIRIQPNLDSLASALKSAPPADGVQQ